MEAVAEGVEMKLNVKYTGPEPDRGRMNAIDLGPAIFGLGEMVGAASRIAYGDETRVRVEVHADLHHASFGIDFSLVSAMGGLVHGLSLSDLANLATLLGVVGTAAAGGVKGVKGVIGLMGWQRGRKIDQAEKVGDTVNIRIGDETKTVTTIQYNVFIDPTVRKGLKALAEPLEREGVESVEMRTDDEPEVTINRADRKSFLSAPLPDEEVLVSTSRAVLEIISPALRGNFKWRLAQGGNVFFVEMADEDFMADVAKDRELFGGAGHAIVCDLEVTTRKDAERFSFSYRVTKVHEHIKGARGGEQGNLLE